MSTWSKYFAGDPSPEELALDLEVYFAATRGSVHAPPHRYNSYFDTELQARAAWEVYRELTRQEDAKFPEDRMPREYVGRPDGLQVFRRGYER